jgi:hypothetical protein
LLPLWFWRRRLRAYNAALARVTGHEAAGSVYMLVFDDMSYEFKVEVSGCEVGAINADGTCDLWATSALSERELRCLAAELNAVA